MSEMVGYLLMSSIVTVLGQEISILEDERSFSKMDNYSFTGGLDEI